MNLKAQDKAIFSRRRLGQRQPPPSIQRHREGPFWRGLGTTIGITFFLILCNWLLEDKTAVGRSFEQWTYDQLQRILPIPRSSAVPVVLDLSDAPTYSKETLPKHWELFTDRETLQGMVDAAVKQTPLAIGIDVDFSPGEKGFQTLYDWGFLNHIQNLTKQTGVPIFVGVHESTALGPERWLWDPKFMPLAACIVVPRSEEDQSTRTMPEVLKFYYKTAEGGTWIQPCRALGAAVAKNATPEVRWYLRPFLQANQIKGDENSSVVSKEFLVDYSPVNGLSGNLPKVSSAADIDRLYLTKKMVFFGWIQNRSDLFTIPGRPEHPYPGVILHASAAYTLFNQRPLYQLTVLGRISLDVAFSAFVFVVFWYAMKRKDAKEQESTAEGFHKTVTFAFMLILVVAFALLSRYVGFMWDDFFFVLGALLVHSRVEHLITLTFGSMEN
jgi:hypothetical protein